MAKILIVDDDATFCLMLKTFLEKHKHQVATIFSPLEVRKALKDDFYNIILTDLRMPKLSGLDVIRLVKKQSPQSQIVVMTNYADITTAVRSIKLGAFNYIPKPFQPEELLNIIEDVVRDTKNNHVSQNNSTVFEPNNYLEGKSSASLRLKELIRLVAPTPMSVLITGESGTGKEYIARFLHASSPRADKPFVSVDCGAIPHDLVASEFFGHEKGAFTGAVNEKTGHFVTAQGGTIFLDEVGNLSYDAQIQLLRVIQERVVKPVGSTKEIPINVRIIAATNEDLRAAMEDGHFREDLFHRLNEFQIEAPPLRNRQEDILLFARYFLQQANKYLNRSVSGFDEKVETVFRNYSWPGNLREMNNVVKRATLLAKGEMIGLNEIPDELYNSYSEDNPFRLFGGENEQKMILNALEKANYNKSKAARLLGIDRKTLYNKLETYKIDITKKDAQR